jgi:hypothetical protein
MWLSVGHPSHAFVCQKVDEHSKSVKHLTLADTQWGYGYHICTNLRNDDVVLTASSDELCVAEWLRFC